MTDEITEDLESYYIEFYPPLTPEDCSECGYPPEDGHADDCSLREPDI